MGRFINADAQISTVGGEIKGYNMFAYSFNNPINMDDASGNWPKWITSIVNAVVKTVKKIINYVSLPTKKEHYARNDKNPKFPEKFDEKHFEDWDDSVSANCHQFTSKNRTNKKYVSKDGKQEAIYDSSGNLVTDARDVGTYNFISPIDDKLGHAIKDVIPWILYGNTEDDSTKWWNRAGALVGIYDLGDIIPIFAEE